MRLYKAEGTIRDDKALSGAIIRHDQGLDVRGCKGYKWTIWDYKAQ